MCLFKYREKRYGKLTLVLASLLLLALAGLSVWGGFYAVYRMAHWSKYVIVTVAIIVALGLVSLGLAMFLIAFSLISKTKSVRDGNRSKGVADVRLCDKCGRPVSKKAQICEHCGAKLQTGLGMKDCPECKTKNSATASFCEKCGYEFKY